MDSEQFGNDALATAADLLRDEIDEKTRLGRLILVPDDDSPTWDVYRFNGDVRVYVDTLNPRRFGSAQLLGAYLKQLHSDQEGELPKAAGHSGQILL